MNTKITLFLMAVVLVLSSCGGGGGGGSSITPYVKLKKCAAVPGDLSKLSKPNLTLKWSCDFFSENGYNLDIYLSNDTHLDKTDTLLIHTVSTLSNDNITLKPSDHPYRMLMDTYGGHYYLLFDAYIDPQKEHDVFAMSFTLRDPWTVMVYIDGDNSLTDAVESDLEEMESVGTTPNINVVVQVDTKTDTTKRYLVKQASLQLIKNLGEINMGRASNLSAFILWAMQDYPADHYLVVLWDHGRGFEPMTRDILIDANPPPVSEISVPQLADALDNVTVHTGKRIDIIGMDACLMGMVEVAYAIRDYADYMVASESTAHFYGYAYDKILTWLNANAYTATRVELSKVIASTYVEEYPGWNFLTMSSVDLHGIQRLFDDINGLAENLIRQLNSDMYGNVEYALTQTIFNSVQRYDDLIQGTISTNDSYADLYDLARLIAANQYMDNQTRNCAQLVMNDIASIVFANEHSGTPVQNSHGLSIWYPNATVYSMYSQKYSQLSFAKNGLWLDLIKRILNVE